MKLLIINGPNLNMLGKREPEIYGKTSLEDLNKDLAAFAKKEGISLDCFQSNHDGEIVDKIQEATDGYDGLIINAGALTHYSVSVRDALACLKIPKIEVHISNIYQREDFRKTSLIAAVCDGQITGLGLKGYFLAIRYWLR